MNDLDKLLADYKGAYLSYPQVRRDVEFKLMAALVDEVKALKAAIIPVSGVSGPIFTREMGRYEADLPTPIVVDVSTAEVTMRRKPGRPPKVEEAA